MTSTEPISSSQSSPTERAAFTVAFIGNPNVGKTTLFNKLAGRKQKTSNFPGTTQEAHVATLDVGGRSLSIIDLPGIYSLGLDQSESSICRGVLEGSVAPAGTRAVPPDCVLLVLDGTNLLRNLRLAGEVLARKKPTAVVVTMVDDASRRGIHIDSEKLSAHLGCPVVLVSNKTGKGIDEARALLSTGVVTEASIPIEQSELERWADAVYADVCADDAPAGERDRLTDRLDRAFTHPVLGVVTFAAIMTGLFWVIFTLASVPMDGIDWLFATLGSVVADVLPEGPVRDLLTDGVIAGVGGTVIFLPQIILLFFLIALLEQSGYLARAAFVIDRLLRPFGLPGHAFVPFLSAHACAIPAIMSARAVPDRRDRLATILVVPFMSCSARIPVYVLLTQILFPGSSGKQALAFTGCYVLGILAGLVSAVIARGTILRGRSRPMALELPRYQLPGLIYATKQALYRGWLFVRKAGTVILAISVVLWWLNAYPSSEPSPVAESLRTEAAEVARAEPGRADELLARADAEDTKFASRNTFLGRIGSTIQPVFAPIGADRQLTVGILASFAAREVFVSTMAVQIAGSEDTEDETVFEAVSTAERDDGSPVFTEATSWSMLVFFVLAIQCLPTLVVTAKEAGGWKWAGLQFAWMTGVAYISSLAVYTILTRVL
ncbi:MAG: ferrous iron transporter B [Phycisphaerales bacterium]